MARSSLQHVEDEIYKLIDIWRLTLVIQLLYKYNLLNSEMQQRLVDSMRPYLSRYKQIRIY
jgi:hypothetical protein